MANATNRALALLLTLAAALPARADDHLAVDTAIVLAVDVSGSMDDEELEIQRAGYLEALRHPDLIRIVQTGRHRRIALSYFEWAGQPRAESTAMWRLIDSAEAAQAFAGAIEALPLRTSYGTSIARALDHALGVIAAADFSADAWVIDVSGDGPNNMGPPVTEARDRALTRGVTINGLPIVLRPSGGAPDLETYYATCVTGGLGSFVLPARGAEELAPAIRRKLFREMIGGPVERLERVQGAEPYDCLIGERLRRERGRF